MMFTRRAARQCATVAAFGAGGVAAAPTTRGVFPTHPRPPPAGVRWAHTKAWLREVDLMTGLREVDADDEARQKQLTLIFEKAKRQLTRAVARGDDEEFLHLLDRLEREFGHLDRRASDGESDADTHFSAWGHFLAKNDRVMTTLLAGLRSRHNMELLSRAARFYLRSVQWVPEQIELLVQEHGLLEEALRLTAHCYRSRSDLAPMAFLHSLCLLAHVMRACEGIDYARRGALYAEYPLLQWWRTATNNMREAQDSSPFTVIVFNRMLLEAATNDRKLMQSITLADFDAMERAALSVGASGEQDMSRAVPFKERDYIVVYCGITALKFAEEDYVFLGEMVKKNYIDKLARQCRQAKWNDKPSLVLMGDMLLHAMRAASAFANRYPKEVSAAGLVSVVLDKMRYTLGYLQYTLKEAKREEVQSTIQDANALFTAAMSFLGEFSRGEIMEQQYNSAAYNDERVQILRSSKLPSMMSRLLRMYPTSDEIASDCCTIVMLLFNYKEQMYDMRDCELLSSFLVCREKLQSQKAQQRVLRVVKLLQERTPI